MHGPIDPGVIAEWAIPALLVALALGAIGLRLSRRARAETDTTFAFVLVALLFAGGVVFVDYSLATRRVFSDEQIRGTIGLLMLGSCCAAPGIGALFAGALWAIAHAARRRPEKPPETPVEL